LVNLSLLELVAVEDVMVRAETLHLEHQDSRSIWLHTVEDLLKEMVSLDLWVQEQITEQELAQAEAVKENGRTHGAQAEAEAELLVLDTTEDSTSITQEDTQDTLVEAEAHQRALQAVAQEWLTQTTPTDARLADKVVQVFTVLQAEAEAEAVVLVVQDQTVEDKVVETLSVHQEKMHLKTQAQAEDAVDQVDLEFV
jgi:hypothetical protein